MRALRMDTMEHIWWWWDDEAMVEVLEQRPPPLGLYRCDVFRAQQMKILLIMPNAFV